jgi:hypothetical protein
VRYYCTYVAKLDIGIEETNAGISIPASLISVWYWILKKAVLHQFSLVPTGSGAVIFFILVPE